MRIRLQDGQCLKFIRVRGVAQIWVFTQKVFQRQLSGVPQDLTVRDEKLREYIEQLARDDALGVMPCDNGYSFYLYRK